MSRNNKYLSFILWLLPLSFFAFQFTLRLWPGLIMQQIMHKFSIDATSYGLLASVYYFGYAGPQIPIAIALDKYGARNVLVFCSVLCGVSMLSFSYTTNWYIALLSRFLIGVGSAGGFLITANVISNCFASKDYSKMVGFSFSVGLLGAVYGGKPLSMLLSKYGWTKIEQSLSLVSILIGVMSFFFLKIQNLHNDDAKEFKMKNILEIFKSPMIMSLATVNLLMVGVLEGFADIWGANYLIAAFNVEKSLAAEVVSFIFIGMLFGGPLLAFLGGKIGNFFAIAFAGIIMSICLLYVIFYLESFNFILLSIVFLCIGAMCCYQVLILTVGSKIAAPAISSVTVAFLNCINMLGGVFFHSIIGFGMDFFSKTVVKDALYAAETYQKTLIIIPLCCALGSIITIVAKTLKR